MNADLNHSQTTAQDILKMLQSSLSEIGENLGDPGALAPVMSKLTELVDEVLPRLSGLEMGPEEKAQMVQVQMQIAEIERHLQMRGSILSGFSLHLKEMIQG